ncbi:hypothetical protein A3A05_03605 [Candidatus Nomurabacteria bacterium RIFCSPLOWO2_01_FULL_41_12]|uniref:Peptidoglycan binding-like domain-containing protein n=1 Tax=Candidatus Nomurabacteria bacterium RIFCSPLOWO2_01_FULL_41_12 TaxID=1801774 RepID=A0A1F6WUV9_9BACT|nr:MAG: hypothetical protein A2732_02280 [Candidatus Nomurabacteria bacterium RIFCSPHIGHO2_01_FULL_40_10]OGI85683.1 MAG: hypothetical protein A3A05_03605 [Candidatus Nomurabacteria bacterium RIFCSPLOWO2_01_FULL_41_12]
MKKYILASFVFILSLILLGFNVNSASAANCAPGDLFNTATGQSCDTIPAANDCAVGDLFSSLTGKPCNISQDNSSLQKKAATSSNTSSQRELTLGLKGSDVKELQQILKDAGYYLGKIDGNYGKRTARAIREFQDDNEISVTGKVDANTFAKIKEVDIVNIDTSENIRLEKLKVIEDNNPMLPSTPFPSTSKPIPILSTPEPTTSGFISEQVKCVFNGSKTNQSCYTTNRDGKQFTFYGIETVVGTVSGYNGEMLTWKSSCGGYAYTTMDGQNKYANFSCATVSPLLSSITVLSPNGGESIVLGSTYFISWSSSNMSEGDSVRIELYKNGVYQEQIAFNQPVFGTYNWIPSGKILTGADYKIRIVKAYDNSNSIFDESDSYFSIVSGINNSQPPVITSI